MNMFCLFHNWKLRLYCNPDGTPTTNHVHIDGMADFTSAFDGYRYCERCGRTELHDAHCDTTFGYVSAERAMCENVEEILKRRGLILWNPKEIEARRKVEQHATLQAELRQSIEQPHESASTPIIWPIIQVIADGRLQIYVRGGRDARSPILVLRIWNGNGSYVGHEITKDFQEFVMAELAKLGHAAAPEQPVVDEKAAPKLPPRIKTFNYEKKNVGDD